MSSKSPEAQASIDVLRALLNVQKRPLPLPILLKEYREMEGRILPYRSFGFKSAEEFLKTSGEFLIMGDNGDVLVGARPNKDSAHIVKMVSCQKGSRKRSSRTSSNKNRMPTRSGASKTSYLSDVYRILPSLSSFGNYVDWFNRTNNLAYSSQQSKLTQKSVAPNVNNRLIVKNEIQPKQIQKSAQAQASSASSSLTRKIDPLIVNKGSTENTNKLHEQETFSQFMNSQNSIIQLRRVERLSKDLWDAKSICESNISEKDYLRITCNNTNYQKERTVSESKSDLKISFENNSSKPKENEYLFKKAGNLKKIISNVENNGFKDFKDHTVSVFNKENLQQTPGKNMIEHNKDLLPNFLTPPVSPLNEKFDLQTNVFDLSTNIANNTLNPPNSKTFRVTNEEEKGAFKQYEFNFKLNPVTSLEQYCLARGYAEPQYESKYYNGLLFSVTINGKKYSTYPKFFNDEKIAKNACAAIAIEEIKLEESKFAKYPVSTNSDSELLMKIYEELKNNHTSGIFIKMFPKFFELTFQQMLPHHWFSLIESSKYFLLESTIDIENTILVANLNPDDSGNLDEIDDIIIDTITLPWDKKYWNLYITHCASTTEIWARLIEYSQELESLLNYIDDFMLSGKVYPDSISTGQFYLVYISDTWHRVKLERLNDDIDRCLCFFIDFGDKDWLSIDQLYVCDKKFLRLPPQAVSFSLFGLEDFTENPISNKCLNETIMGGTLVAEILRNKETCGLKTNEVNKIEVVLYDTSSNIDIIVNEVLIEKICAATPIPELKKNSPTNVNITHISDTGDIYLQILDSNFYYMQKLLSQLIESKFQHEQYKIKLEELNLTNLYLIADEEKWYRGSLVDIDVKNRNAKEFKIFYVDYGLTKQVNISNIFSLESLSTALNRYPRQAIKANMFNMPPSNEFVLNKLKSMLPNNSLAIVKLIINELSVKVIPQIIVFIRVEKNQSLCNVNDAIRMEYELISNNTSSEVFNSSTMNESFGSPSKVHPTSEHELLPIELHSNVCIPDKGEIFNVLVTVASSPFDFYLRQHGDNLEYENMMEILQTQCQNNKEIISAGMIEPGEAYATRLEDGLYHRCIIEKTLSNQKCSVYFCDLGNRNIIDIKALCALPSKCRDLPTQAIKAKLHGIVPIKDNWSQNDNKRFYDITVGKVFIAVVKNILYDHLDFYRNSKVLELKLIDQSNYLIVHEILLEENRAILS